MRIGIIGAGSVGGTLGRGWTRRGHEVMFGLRDASEANVRRRLAELDVDARAGSIAEAASFGETLVLATPWSAAQDALKKAGDLQGSVLLDCTNPLKADLSGLQIGGANSGAEQVALWAPGARVVKIFNTTGFKNMANPRFGNEPATMFYCGDDAAAKRVAGRLAEDLGFEAVDAGPLAEARQLEYLALLWIDLAMKQRLGDGIAFKLLRR